MAKHLKHLLVFLFLGLSAASQQIKIVVTLTGNTTTASIIPTPLKYDKECVFSMDFDDRSPSALPAFDYMNQKTFTDGAGLAIKYTAGVASNAVNMYGLDFSVNGVMTLEQLKILVDGNWCLSDHGYYHDIPSEKLQQGFTITDNIVKNRKYHYDKLKLLGTQYVMRTGVVPGNTPGYHPVWELKGYLGGTSQNTFDFYPIIPTEWETWNNGYVGDITNFNAPYQAFARSFVDLTADAMAYYKASLNAMLTQSNATTKKIWRVGVHYADIVYLTQVMDYVQTNGNDRAWVTSFQEMLEYFEAKRKTLITQSISGNILTVALDQSQLPDAAKWRDMTFKLSSDKSIASVTVTGADNFSFNPSTGLVNIYKKKTVFADPDGAIATPAFAFTSFSGTNTTSGNELTWVVTNEANILNYQVEKSGDSITYSNVATLTATSQNSYSYTDTKATGNQYYRIKAIDKNGGAVYSSVIRITKGGKKKPATAVYQSGTLHIEMESETEGNIPIAIFDHNGLPYYSEVVYVQKGSNNIDITEFNAQPGLYFARVAEETVRFVK